MRLVFLGAPGAGKGTIAKMLCNEFMWPHISTGDAFRSIMSKDTALAKEVKAVVESGKLVNDALTKQVVEERLKSEDSFILDGYPRNFTQVVDLDQILKSKGQSLDAVVYFEVPKSELVARLSGRLTCKNGHIFNLNSNPPKVSGKCDVCKSDLVQRADDSAEKVKERLDVYAKQTKPLIAHYEKKGLLIKVKQGSIADVYSATKLALKK